MTVTAADIKSLAPLHVANDVLDEPEALDKLWDEDGYLFFRDVVDRDAVAEVAETYRRVLAEMGVVDPDSREPVWNGANIQDFPFKIPGIEKSRIWERFVANSQVRSFAAKVFHDEPYWLPMTEYRVTPPQSLDEGDALLFRHQDALLNAGIPFRVFWIPLTEIDAEAGGLVVAEGWHRRGFIHDPDDAPMFAIKADTIPDSAWRRADYRPGDVLVFSTMIPHSGTRNFSRSFRCSMDLRVMRASDQRPLIGEVAAVERDSITIRDNSGLTTRLTVTPDSTVRGKNRMKISSHAALQAELPVGLRVVVGYKDGVVVGLRPER